MEQPTGSKEGDVFSLILKAKEGNLTALQELLQHPVVKNRALMMCQRIILRNPKSGYYRDAEDLRQELFMSFCQNLDKFRCEYGEASFWRFFEVLARNIHLSQARKSTREIKQSEEKCFDEFDVASQEDQHFCLSIQEALNSLDDRERFILEQRVDGKGLEEIAKAAPFDITKSTVHRILENIQKKFIAVVDDCQDKKTTKQARKKRQDDKKQS